MFAVNDSPRGTVYILFIGMIATLSIHLANAHKCWDSFQTEEGGWAVSPGTANRHTFLDCGRPKPVIGLGYTTYKDRFST
ncbi:hypothetical protein H4Q26_009634 [Puccinia striiformis f. sp. tritici PST-130]|nr:hypothetical protein H4Q26_009634 [Puccinia striiformis f. sp. tritici PST-130]